MIISIKPKYVKNILDGKKKYEYRKRIFVKKIDRIYIYSTSPEKRIVGYFKYIGFVKETPQKIWEETKDKAGIDEKSFFNYFINCDFAYAIIIGKVQKFEKPIDPKVIFNKFVPPQSFVYIEGDTF